MSLTHRQNAFIDVNEMGGGIDDEDTVVLIAALWHDYCGTI